jgi:hypothetical protein
MKRQWRLLPLTFIFISSRPADKVNNEISITMGYPFQPRSEATLGIGSVSFALATRQDTAWIKNPVEEPNLIEAMRAGQNAVLKGKSAKGTHSTDILRSMAFGTPSTALRRTASKL